MTKQPTIPGVSKGVRSKNIRVVVVSTLAELIRRTALGDIGPGALVSELRGLAETIEGKGNGAEPVAPKNQEMLEAWVRLFNHWKTSTGKNAKKTAGRREKVLARMRAGYSEAAIRTAIDGCLSDEWCLEKGKTDLVYICQSDERLEEMIDKAGGLPDAPERVVPDEKREKLEALEQKAMDALERGDNAIYEAVQEQIERIQRDPE
jgi:hypothetical protein